MPLNHTPWRVLGTFLRNTIYSWSLCYFLVPSWILSHVPCFFFIKLSVNYLFFGACFDVMDKPLHGLWFLVRTLLALIMNFATCAYQPPFCVCCVSAFLCFFSTIVWSCGLKLYNTALLHYVHLQLCITSPCDICFLAFCSNLYIFFWLLFMFICLL